MRNWQRSAWYAMLRTPLSVLAAALVSTVLLMAIFAPVIWGDDAARMDTTSILQGPADGHLLGTDRLGRDIFYRTLVATRLTIALALLASLIGLSAGVVLGTLPSLLGRRIGRAVAALVNILVAFPPLLLILFFAVVFGVGTTGAVLALGLAMAPFFARLTQTLAASVAGRDFVAAARIAGVGRFRLFWRHILPNIGEQLIINGAMGAGTALLSFAALSFLGIGIQAPEYDWGQLLNTGLDGIYVNPSGAFGPAVAVVVAGLAFNLFGEAAAQAVGKRTPKVKGSPASTPALPEAHPTESPAGDALVVAENLRVSYPGRNGWVSPVRGVNLTLRAGESVGVVGESGSGKSQTALALARLIDVPGRVYADRLEFAGTSLLPSTSRADRNKLASELTMVFQDPMASFNPAQSVGTQLGESARHHQGLSRKAAHAKVVDRLRAVRIPGAERRSHQYPHEFSGGMRQRAMIAMGLMGTPRLIIADEPTTALDVTVQRQVLRVLEETRAREGAAMLLISHDISVVEQVCDRILVMYAGRVVEDLPADRTDDASHPYTRALLSAVPDMETDREQPLAVIPGRPPEPGEVPAGCSFEPRCPFATDRCRTEDPSLAVVDGPHRVACWHPQNSAAGQPAKALVTGGINE